jgi:DnaJ-class molecular chaperone
MKQAYPVDSYPLTWPPGRPRQHGRESARFQTLLGAAIVNIQREVKMLGGTELVISSNLPLRRDGAPSARGGGYLGDVGVAVYFTLKKKPMSFACDRWDEIEDNMQAIALTIGALRGLDRWGSGQMVEQAFSGFTALPSPPQWWQILAVKSTATRDEIEQAYRQLAWTHHPDRSNRSDEMMARINRARDQGLEQFS